MTLALVMRFSVVIKSGYAGELSFRLEVIYPETRTSTCMDEHGRIWHWILPCSPYAWYTQVALLTLVRLS